MNPLPVCIAVMLLHIVLLFVIWKSLFCCLLIHILSTIFSRNIVWMCVNGHSCIISISQTLILPLLSLQYLSSGLQLVVVCWFVVIVESIEWATISMVNTSQLNTSVWLVIKNGYLRTVLSIEWQYPLLHSIALVLHLFACVHAIFPWNIYLFIILLEYFL